MPLTLARVITAALLVASAAAFATGATIERHTASNESAAVQQHAETGTAGEGSSGENPGGEHPAGSSESSATHAAAQGSEDLLGINPEATGLVVIAVLVSLLLAGLVLTVRSPLLTVGVALAMLAFTALDIRELAHQLHESRPGLAALATTVAVLHLAAGVAGVLATRNSRGISTA